MKTLAILIFVFPIVLALTKNDMEFGIEYFLYRHVKYICLLTCWDNKFRINQFTKYSSKNFIGVSIVFLENFNLRKLGSCSTTHMGDVGILVDSDCPISKDVLYYASENSLFDSSRKWLLIESNMTDYNNTLSAETIGRFNDLNMNVNADLFVAKVTDNGYEMYEIFNYGKIQGGELIINNLGVWSDGQGFNEDLNGYMYYRRWNFQQLSMRMVVVMTSSQKAFEPAWLLDPRQTPGLATILKTSGMILKEVAELHNFRFNYTVMDRWIGDYTVNDSKTVASTSLYYKLQDVTPVLRFENAFVLSKVDLVHPPLTSIETRYYYRIPTYGPGKFENQFLRPLSSGAWLCVVLISVMCGCLLLLTAKLERRQAAGQYAFFSVLASICQQFFEDNNESGTGNASSARKLIVIVTGASCLLVYNYYTSSVVSWLLSGPPPSINTLEELLDSPLELIFEDVGYARSWLKSPSYFFNRRNEKIENLLRQKKVLNKRNIDVLTNLERGIAMVKAGGYAFHTEVDSANRLISQKFTQTELCELGSIDSMKKSLLYVTVQKNSPFKEFLNWSLKRFNERGIVSVVQRRTRSSQVECEGSSPRALTLGGAAPAFILLVAGYVLALAIMMVERMAEKRNLQILRSMLK
ncbi:uncharacterized protein LOC106141871 [Amyelois transitella]|uniref:uncharacterized protein LOC106141871 n=1 Tax=Amyelois transitella TaxID=680683 RepID=UPI0029905213|nr:uncharacterized protein LOC106141871 [Amyelois transitella]